MPIKKTAPKKENNKILPKKEITDKNSPLKKEKKFRQTFQSVKGVYEILPAEAPFWNKLEDVVKKTAQFYNFEKIETGIIEQADLFSKSSGEGSDLVNKEMFYLKSGNGKLVLRPEGTASVARAYLEYGFSSKPQPVRLFYFGPMFRHENPQAGRYRQFYQAGFEIIGGENDPVFDVEAIQAAFKILKDFGLKDASIKLNSIGCRVCRPSITKRLVNYFKNKNKEICGDCERRLRDNPLRILDCKKESCKKVAAEAPILLDGLCSFCKSHFKNVLEYLEELDISYEIDNSLVRGLDYYSRTVFEFFVPAEGETKGLAIGGGGRYDYLLEAIGGRATPGVGFSLGAERLIKALKEKKGELPEKSKPPIFFIHVGDVAKKKALSLIEELRSAGLKVVESLSKDSFGKQLKLADRAGAEVAIIFGQKEVFEESIIVKDLKTGVQETVLVRKMTEYLKKKMGK